MCCLLKNAYIGEYYAHVNIHKTLNIHVTIMYIHDIIYIVYVYLWPCIHVYL